MTQGTSARAAATAHPICKPISPGTAEHWTVCASSFALTPASVASLTLRDLRRLLDAAIESGHMPESLHQALYACGVLVQMGLGVELHAARAGVPS